VRYGSCSSQNEKTTVVKSELSMQVAAPGKELRPPRKLLRNVDWPDRGASTDMCIVAPAVFRDDIANLT
jgi:hypothetical protein